MKLDRGTKEEKAIENTFLSNSISNREVSSALQRRLWLCGMCCSPQPSRFEMDEVLHLADTS